MLGQRIADRRILRLVRRWLKAGILEGGEWVEVDRGTPQGSGMTPPTQKISSSSTPF